MMNNVPPCNGTKFPDLLLLKGNNKLWVDPGRQLRFFWHFFHRVEFLIPSKTCWAICCSRRYVLPAPVDLTNYSPEFCKTCPA